MARPNQTRWSSAVMIIPGLLSLALPELRAQWIQTTSLPDGYGEHSLVYASGFLHQAGGASNPNGEGDGFHVFYAQVYTNGTIGAWTSATSLPEAVFDHAGVTANGFVYVLGGVRYTVANGDVVSDVVYYSKINSNGSLSAWVPRTPPSVPTNSYGSGIYGQASVANGMLYVLGGIITGGTQMANSVYYSKINSNGTLAGWNETTPLPQTLSNFGAVAARGRVFVMLGYNGSGPANNFYSAPVAGDGSLGSWLTGNPLPQSLSACAVAITESNIFLEAIS